MLVFCESIIFPIFFIRRSPQVTSVENANAAPTAITALLVFRTASAFRAIATWQEV